MSDESAGTAPVLFGLRMSDGVSLAAARWSAQQSPAPVVVTFTPYRKERAWPLAVLAMALGCHMIAVDVRGLGGSAGAWDGPLSEREVRDGADVLEWVAAQPFCDGQTALVGCSYCGMNQYLIAACRPRGLRCIAPAVAPLDYYRDMWHRGGIPSHPNWGATVGYLNQHRPDVSESVVRDFYLNTALDPFDNERCLRRSAERVLDEIEVPVLVSGGWYDYFLRGTLRAFQRLSAAKRLVVGNWSHEDLLTTRPRELSEWLDYWLCGHGTDPTKGDNVVLQCVGSDAWESCGHWPDVAEIAWRRWLPVAEPTRIAIPGSLSELPSTSAFHLSPAYDLATNSGMHLWGEAWKVKTPAASERTRLRGPVALQVALLSADAADVDLHARISIVRADGSVHQVTEGRLRASHRALDVSRCEMTSEGDVAVAWHLHDRSDTMTVGEPVALEVEVFPINLELVPGESLQLGITLVRADHDVAPADAVLLPTTRVLLPLLDPLSWP